MAKFNFYLKGAKATPEYRRSTKPALILLFVSHDGKRSKFSTSQTVAPNCWDFKNQQCKSSATNAAALNECLKSYKNSVEQTLLGLKTEIGNPSTELLKSEVQLKEARQAETVTMLEAFEAFIQENAQSYRHGTLRVFRTTMNRIQVFEAKKRLTLRLDKFSMKDFDSFVSYMEKELSLTKNTIANEIKITKTVLNWVVRTERLPNFKMPKLKVSWEEVPNVYLNETELAHLWALDLASKPRLERVRDLFLVGCWTGLRFSDFTKLKAENILGNVAKIQTQKTGEVVTIPVHPILRQILDKYQGDLPREITNQKMNDYLKEIAQIASFDEMGMDTKTKGGVKTSQFKAKWERISTHTARRSFATNQFKAGFPSILLMKITGHKTEKAFLKYIKVDQEEAANQLAQLWERNYHPQTRLEAV